MAGGTARAERREAPRSEAAGLPQAATGLAGSAARTRRNRRGTSNAAAHARGVRVHASDRHREAETRPGLGEDRRSGGGRSRARSHESARREPSFCCVCYPRRIECHKRAAEPLTHNPACPIEMRTPACLSGGFHSIELHQPARDIPPIATCFIRIEQGSVEREVATVIGDYRVSSWCQPFDNIHNAPVAEGSAS